MLRFKLNGDEGVCQGRIGVNSNGFLRHGTRGVSTPDLIVTEFRMGCRQTDLASACVLHPLNRLVLDFKMEGMAEMNGWRSGVCQTGDGRGDYSQGRS